MKEFSFSSGENLSLINKPRDCPPKGFDSDSEFTVITKLNSMFRALNEKFNVNYVTALHEFKKDCMAFSGWKMGLP